MNHIALFRTVDLFPAMASPPPAAAAAAVALLSYRLAT